MSLDLESGYWIPIVVASVFYYFYYWFCIVKPTIFVHAPQSRLQEYCRQSKSIRRFDPCYWIPTNHLQMIGARLIRGSAAINYEREYIKLSDGGVCALDWHPANLHGDSIPTLLALHGITGSSASKYMKNTVQHFSEAGWRVVVLNGRGCGTAKLTSPKTHSGESTEEIRAAVVFVNEKFPSSPLYTLGYSLGANLMAKYLGEEGKNTQIQGFVSIVNPFDFVHLQNKLPSRSSTQLYNRLLTIEFKSYLHRHQEVLKDHIDYSKLSSCKWIADIDEIVSIKLHNFSSVMELYEKASSISHLSNIRVPTLFLNSMDDPISCFVPLEEAQKNPNLLFAITQRGGHGAFLTKINKSWADECSLEFLEWVRTHSKKEM